MSMASAAYGDDESQSPAARRGSRWRTIRKLLVATIDCWSDHNSPRLGAALAFYTLLSLAPMVMVLVPITSLVVGEPKTEQAIIRYAEKLAGPVGASSLKTLIDSSLKKSGGGIPGLLALITLLFGASSMFAELRNALNTIWDYQPQKKHAMWKSLVRRYAMAMLTVIALDAFLFVSISATAVAASMGNFVKTLIHAPPQLIEIGNFLVTFAFTTCLVVFAFRVVPDRVIEWRSIWIGGLFTAFLETVGKSLLGLYLGTAAIGSAYGAASSIVAIAVWIYYATQIFFLGAEFTNVYAAYRRDGRVPGSAVTV